VSTHADRAAPAYDAFYEAFESPLSRRVRAEAYGEDIGQHSWVTAADLRADAARLRLSPASRLLDVGCGPGGPLTFLLREIGGQGTGLDRSAPALAAARRRAASLGVGDRLTLVEADLDEPLPVESRSFEAAMAIDVVLHLRDRLAAFREISRALVPGGRFLLTDAGVLTGPVSEAEAARRGSYGPIHLHPAGFNEPALENAGLRVLESRDRTSGLLGNATGRLRARLAHRDELVAAEGEDAFARQQGYLETVIDLARRGALARTMYLAERRPA
jgi:SAM-dependent methyltransferase